MDKKQGDSDAINFGKIGSDSPPNKVDEVKFHEEASEKIDKQLESKYPEEVPAFEKKLNFTKLDVWSGASKELAQLEGSSDILIESVMKTEDIAAGICNKVPDVLKKIEEIAVDNQDLMTTGGGDLKSVVDDLSAGFKELRAQKTQVSVELTSEKVKAEKLFEDMRSYFFENLQARAELASEKERVEKLSADLIEARAKLLFEKSRAEKMLIELDEARAEKVNAEKLIAERDLELAKLKELFKTAEIENKRLADGLDTLMSGIGTLNTKSEEIKKGGM